MAQHYHYTHETSPTKIDLPIEQNAGHGDHWAILTDDISNDVPKWIHDLLENAVLPNGLVQNNMNNKRVLLATNDSCHIKQVLAAKDGTPTGFINSFPAVNSPYGLTCQIERVINCHDTTEAILKLKTKDGTTIYAYDQLYAVNRLDYKTKDYYVNFSAWAYEITPSNQDESIIIEDQKAIRYHRAFSDVVAKNNGIVPDDIEEQIAQWQPEGGNEDTILAPVEVNYGHSCIYLFGDTFGQEDEAWCQGQILGISQTQFYDKAITLFDVIILREKDAENFVVRIATPTTVENSKLQVNDFIQANIWLQAAIYAQNQK